MSKTVLVFGAGLNQLTLIEAVKRLGYVAIVVDPFNNPPGKPLADQFYQVAKDDYPATRKVAVKHGIAGIVTAQMENPLKIMARLADDLGYIFHTPEVVEQTTNKYLMKQAFLRHGIPCAAGSLIEAGRIVLQEEFERLTPPLIIKPLQAFSSRGVFKVGTYADYLHNIQATLDFCPGGDYLLEEFLEGQEFSVESITFRGKTTVVQITQKIITPYPTTVEMGHIQPADLNCEERISIEKLIPSALAALGIDNSASHTELKLTPRGPVIIEIGPRLGGDFISSYLTKASTGVDMDEAAVQVALGEKPDLHPKWQRGSAIAYLQLPAGKKVASISWSDLHAIRDPRILQMKLFLEPGSIVPAITDSSRRPGWVIVEDTKAKAAYKFALEILSEVSGAITLTDNESEEP